MCLPFSRSNFPNEQLIAQVFLKTNPIQTYAELLQKQSGVFIRSKGYGALSTPSFKGLGTMHLPIMINGVNMQSPFYDILFTLYLIFFGIIKPFIKPKTWN